MIIFPFLESSQKSILLALNEEYELELSIYPNTRHSPKSGLGISSIEMPASKTFALTFSVIKNINMNNKNFFIILL